MINFFEPEERERNEFSCFDDSPQNGWGELDADRRDYLRDFEDDDYIEEDIDEPLDEEE